MVLGSLNVPLLSGATGTQSSPAVDVRGYPNLSVYLTGTGTISAGTVTVTTAPTATYGGTWGAVTVTLTPTGVTGGATQQVPLPVGAYAFLRATITGAITGGGTIDLLLIGA
jgi:hypothetical protein